MRMTIEIHSNDAMVLSETVRQVAIGASAKAIAIWMEKCAQHNGRYSVEMRGDVMGQTIVATIALDDRIKAEESRVMQMPAAPRNSVAESTS